MSLRMTPPLWLLPRSLTPPLPEALPPLRRQKVAASDKGPTLNAPTASLVAISTPLILTAALAPKDQLKDGLYWSLEYMKKQGRMDYIWMKLNVSVEREMQLAGWMANPTVVPHQAVFASPVGLTAGAPSNAAASAQMLKRPRTPPANAPPVDYQTADSKPTGSETRPTMSDNAYSVTGSVAPSVGRGFTYISTESKLTGQDLCNNSCPTS